MKTLSKLLRWSLMAGGVLFFIGLALFVFVLRPGLESRRASATASAVYIERRTLDDTLNASGALRPAQTVNLNFETSGKVALINVQVGDTIKAGEVLAELDKTNLERALEQAKLTVQIQQANYDTLMRPPTEDQITRAKAALAQAKASLSQAQIQFDNQKNAIITSCASLSTLEASLKTTEEAYKNYVTDGYQFDIEFRPDPNSAAGRAWKNARDQFEVSSAQCESARRVQQGDASVVSALAQVDQAQAALDALLLGATVEQKSAAEAQLNQAKLNLKAAEENLEDAVLRSPVEGIIATVNTAVGQNLTPGGQPAFSIADTSTIYLETSVDENDIPRVAAGQKARFTLQGLPQETIFKGVVESKNTVGQSNQGVVAYPVRIKLEDTPPTYLNMTADVEIIIATREDVLAIATRAIRRAANGDRYIVVERSDGTTIEITVEIGLSVDDVTEIRGTDLREGQKVLIESRNNAFGGTN